MQSIKPTRLALVLLIAGIFAEATAGEFLYVDPSGAWNSQIGSLSLMLTGNALSFSYSSVFGPYAHICDGIGIAGLVTNEKAIRYEYVDESGNTVAFLITKDAIRMEPVSGTVPFCGAGWSGDRFTRDGYHPVERCKVTAKRAYFHGVGPLPPEKRYGYVIAGDAVEVLPLKNEGGEAFVLARFTGSQGTTVGLLKRRDLDCQTP